VSLDLEVYAPQPASLDQLRTKLPEAESWEQSPDVLAYEGDGWQVLVGEPEEVGADEVPDDLAAILPGVRYRIPLTLEPIGAEAEGQTFLSRVLEAVGSATHGVAYDFDTGAPRLI
jgi:hypothetical protein